MEAAAKPAGNKSAGQSVVRSRVIMVDFIAQVVLAVAVGVATSLALAGAVLLLASEAQAQHDSQHQAPPDMTQPAASSVSSDSIEAINRNRDQP
jgi:hypothetical protein